MLPDRIACQKMTHYIFMIKKGVKEKMDLSREDIMKLAHEVYELQKQDKTSSVKEPVYSKEWIKLRKEIDAWCHDNKSGYGSGFQTLQNQIYGAIRFVTGCSYIKNLTDRKVPAARWIFEQMKAGFEKNRS